MNMSLDMRAVELASEASTINEQITTGEVVVDDGEVGDTTAERAARTMVIEGGDTAASDAEFEMVASVELEFQSAPDWVDLEFPVEFEVAEAEDQAAAGSAAPAHTSGSTRGAGVDMVQPFENGSGDPTVAVGASGDQRIDGLLSGITWSDGYITYSDPDSPFDYQESHPESFVSAVSLPLMSPLPPLRAGGRVSF